MSTLKILTAGVTTTGIELLNEVSQKVFGGGCAIEELTTENVKARVRLASRDTSVALVVLDTTAMETCRATSESLYKTDVFYHYESDVSLAEFLNQKYDLSLEVEENVIPIPDEEPHEESINPDVVERYLAQLDEKDCVIKTLNLKVQELSSLIEEGGYEIPTGISEEDFSEVQSENIALKSQISDLNSEISSLKEQISESSSSVGSLNAEISTAVERVSVLEGRLKDANVELADERKLSSQQAAVIRDKDNEIEKLLRESADLQKTVADKAKALTRIKELEGLLNSAHITIRGHEAEMQSKLGEIKRLNSELAAKGDISESLVNYKQLLAESEQAKVELEKQISEVNIHLNEANEKCSELSEELSKRFEKVNELQDAVEEKEKQLLEANNDKIRLEEKIRILDVDDGDSAADEITAELSAVRMQIAEMKLNIFNVLSTKAMPKNSVKVPVIKGIPEMYKNIRFQFAGNAESKRGTYKCMLNEFREMPNEKFLIVDISSETAIDYVFEMKEIIDGMSWFSSGGGVQKYLSSTSLPNVKVLMPSVGYVNDGYFLTVDWARRLRELENSGYRVVLFGGDISNLVGRVLFEAFADIGKTAVYVRGNALGSRAVLANAAGLVGIRKSLIVYFEFDKAMARFYEVMKKRCECKILSYVRE